MTGNNVAARDGFSSKFGVVAAAAGSAVGLGNIWRFPYVAGENGGGAFLLIYLGFILTIGVSVMLAEFIIGRRSQSNALGAFKKLAPSSLWWLVGVMGIIAAFVILAFYTTIAGWTLEYLFQAIGNGFSAKNAAEISGMFDSFQHSTARPLIWQLLFMGLTAAVILGGVQKGIEKYTKLLMPMLVLLIVIMCVRSVTLDGAGEGLKFLFKPDFSKITGNVVLEALGQAFFSMSIGMGALITYGSYVQKDNRLPSTTFQIALADTGIAILAGVMIFPAVFAFGVQPDAGTGLVFQVLPIIFQQMPGGYIFGVFFFLLLTVAALTSTISLLEVVVAWAIEELKMTRRKATILFAAAISVLGVLATLSFSELSEFKLFGKTIFDNLDWLSANLLLPLGGVFIVIFLGWILGPKIIADEVTNQGTIKMKLLKIFIFILRYLAPIAILLVFLNGIGVFGGN
ncbi:MAG: sodium-dependent transporter [Bacteroidales bacterium]|jgi:NSS family neurotransmitter:Na+ symporter|nr:sodium-dependent transporter [Bacteroidales bacterium]